jgi:hypothetical protein
MARIAIITGEIESEKNVNIPDNGSDNAGVDCVRCPPKKYSQLKKIRVTPPAASQ